MYQQLNVQIANLPLTLVLVANGQVAFVKHSETIPTIFDSADGIYDTIISSDNITIKGDEFSYKTGYFCEGVLREWLVRQWLIWPPEENVFQF